MSNAQLAHALEAAQRVGRARFTCVGDISCDVEVRFPTLLSRFAPAHH